MCTCDIYTYMTYTYYVHFIMYIYYYVYLYTPIYSLLPSVPGTQLQWDCSHDQGLACATYKPHF